MNLKPQSVARPPRGLAVAFVLVLTLAFAPATFGSTSKIKCGKPSKTGRIWIAVALRHADGTSATELVPVHVDGSWSAEVKASYLQMAFNAVADAHKVTATLTGDQLTFVGQGDWGVDLVGVAKDSTGESDVVSLGPPTPLSDQDALCSLSGTASGTDSQGGSGFIRLRLGGTILTQQTWPGMPSVVAEQLLIGQLNGAGIPARFATPDDFAGGYESIPHDNEVIWFPAQDTTGYLEQVNDTGLALDLAAVLDGTPEAPSSAPADAAVPGLRLEVFPSPFFSDAVQVRFAGAGRADQIRLEIFDVAGRNRCTLSEGGSANSGTLIWDGRDERHALVPGGVYFVRLSTPSESLIRRVVRVRR
jgi:hypothetical protein